MEDWRCPAGVWNCSICPRPGRSDLERRKKPELELFLKRSEAAKKGAATRARNKAVAEKRRLEKNRKAREKRARIKAEKESAEKKARKVRDDLVKELLINDRKMKKVTHSKKLDFSPENQEWMIKRIASLPKGRK